MIVLDSFSEVSLGEEYFALTISISILITISSLILSGAGCTGWRRLIGSPKLQIIFHKRATKYTSLLRETTYKDKWSYESSPPCTRHFIHQFCRAYTEAHCSTMQHTATPCRTLNNKPNCARELTSNVFFRRNYLFGFTQGIILESNTLQHTAPHCTTLHHTAIHCNTLQHTATHRTHYRHVVP